MTEPTRREAWIRPDQICAWKGSSLLRLSARGEIAPDGQGGYYYRGVRFLSLLRLRIDTRPPHLCSISATSDSITQHLIYPEVAAGATGGSGSGMIHRQGAFRERGLTLRCVMTLRPAGIDMVIGLVNNWDARVAVTLCILTDADYRALSDQRLDAATRPAVGCETAPDGLRYSLARGPAQRHTDITAAGPAAFSASPRGIEAAIDARRHEQATIRVRIRAIDTDGAMTERDMRLREHSARRWRERRCRLSAPGDHPYVDCVNNQIDAVGEAALLEGAAHEWLAPGAGYPLYPRLFGRDALTAAWMIALFDQGECLEHALNLLGRMQGAAEDAFRDEQPGRIIQQASFGAAGENAPFDRYYGDYASPLMYAVAQAFLLACRGRWPAIRAHQRAASRALDWADARGDLDGDGYLEYHTRSPLGPRNQGWKDSENAMVREDGSLAEPPLAACELQGYWYSAMQSAAAFCLLEGDVRGAWSWTRRAGKLKRRFNRDFWVEEGGFIGLALDRHKRLIRSKSSNMGHCLASGIVETRHIGRLVRALFEEDLFSGWGVRTLAHTHPAYNPLSYHLGSVWPVENATIALGLRRYGFTREALRLVEANYRLARLWRRGQTPECIGGYPRGEYDPGAYPQANAPQTWNGAAFGLFTQVLLGLQPVAPARTLFVDPALPAWLPEVTLHNLRIGEATVTIRFARRRTGASGYRVIARQGTLHVLRQPPVNALGVGLGSRIAALARSIW
jgi:glycogen debranching enzyme